MYTYVCECVMFISVHQTSLIIEFQHCFRCSIKVDHFHLNLSTGGLNISYTGKLFKMKMWWLLIIENLRPGKMTEWARDEN